MQFLYGFKGRVRAGGKWMFTHHWVWMDSLHALPLMLQGCGKVLLLEQFSWTTAILQITVDENTVISVKVALLQCCFAIQEKADGPSLRFARDCAPQVYEQSARDPHVHEQREAELRTPNKCTRLDMCYVFDAALKITCWYLGVCKMNNLETRIRVYFLLKN